MKTIILKLLDQYKQAAMHIAEAQVQVRELNKIIDEQIELLGNLKHDILALLTDRPVEEPSPNAVPEDVPPVTDMEEVKKVTGRGGKPKRILMMNMETGEEKQFPSKTMAAQFLGITQQYLAKILKDEGAFKGWWITEDADTPGA
jgi:hypothetical protein